MTGQTEPAPAGRALAQRCRETVARLAGLYGWRLDAGEQALAAAMEVALGDEGEPADRQIEQLACRLHFAALHAGLSAGDAEAEAVSAELFTVRWVEGERGSEVRYAGYLFRSALTVLRRRLAGGSFDREGVEQLAVDAAGRALTTVRARFGDCRDPDAFWGWTARVAERAAIDELRSGRATGGSSVHAASLDDVVEGRVARGAAGAAEERQIDGIAVREELIRKCRLGRLSADQREALVRSFWGGEKPAEIAVALSAARGGVVTAAQVSLWKHRGLQVMEANLRNRGYGDS